jgi:hypothetical protein
MANADLDVIIRQLAKQQHKNLMSAIRTQRDRYAGLAAKSKDAAARQRYKQLAKHTLEEGAAAARRLQMSADNAADSYARAMRKAAEDIANDAAKTASKALAGKGAPNGAARGKKSRQADK